MIPTGEMRQEPLPEAMRQLLDFYPRDSWDAHPNFKLATQSWLGAHQMFRRLSRIVRLDAETYLDGLEDEGKFAKRLSQRGNALIGNLQGHHSWEDYVYFPELSAADPRFDAGLAILERDHQVLDGVLYDFAHAAISTINLISQENRLARDEVSRVHQAATGIENLLARHLTDEEELAVPIILHHKLRG